MLKKALPLGLAIVLLLTTTTAALAAPPPGAGGTFFHDEEGDGVRQMWYLGIENATATLGNWMYTTGTSGWYSFSPVPPGTYTLTAAPPAGRWWTATTPEEHEVTIAEPWWPWPLKNFGYWWGLDAPAGAATAQNGALEMTFNAAKDATIHSWLAGPLGGDIYLRVRQPDVAAALIKFDLGFLPADAEVAWAKLRLCAITPSNFNRLYLTAYQQTTDWNEGTVVWPGVMASDVANDTPVGWDYIPKHMPIPNGFPKNHKWVHVVDELRLGPPCAEIDLDAAVVQSWKTNPESNFGLRVAGEGERSVEVWFASREHPNGPRPLLTVGYDVP